MGWLSMTEFDVGQIVPGPFVVTHGGASELFVPVEESFLEEALSVGPPREGKDSLSLGLWWDIGPGF